MPENKTTKCSDFSCFDSMTDEELQEILRLDAQKNEGEESDMEMILYVMEVLAARRENNSVRTKSAKEAFESFKENYIPCQNLKETEDNTYREPENNKVVKLMPAWLRKLSVAAAVIVVVFVAARTSNALGYDLWDIVVNWTQETFHLGGADNIEEPDLSLNDGRENETLQNTLALYGITEPIAPTWIPDDYEMIDIKVEETPIQKKILAIYRYDDRIIKIQVKKYLQQDPQQIEQSDDLIEVYESAGVLYYIFEDYDQLRAVWVKDRFECYISGQLNIDELKQMIDSIDMED